MATLNLGRIKPVFQGAYNNSTAYVVDDIVTFGDETFICIQASTGNATSNASYWTKLAAKGTDGTDVGTTLTTQGDILYRDGSGLQRLAAGTNGQALLTGGTGANPSWGTISSDFVKLAGTNISVSDNSVASIQHNNIFDSTKYKVYMVFITNVTKNQYASAQVNFRLVDDSNNVISSGTPYHRMKRDSVYNNPGTGGSETEGGQTGGHGNEFELSSWSQSVDGSSYSSQWQFYLTNVDQTGAYPYFWGTVAETDSNNPWFAMGWRGGIFRNNSTRIKGIWVGGNQNIRDMDFAIYGLTK